MVVYVSCVCGFMFVLGLFVFGRVWLLDLLLVCVLWLLEFVVFDCVVVEFSAVGCGLIVLCKFL